MFFYRIRPMDKLLGEYAELDRQEIYFSGPDELNDPMERDRNIVWIGDSILWRNLLRHYVLCLLYAVSEFILALPDKTPPDIRIHSRLTLDDIPSEELKSALDETLHRFLAASDVPRVLQQLSELQRGLRYDEILVILSTVHPAALYAVFLTLSKRELITDVSSRDRTSVEYRRLESSVRLAHQVVRLISTEHRLSDISVMVNDLRIALQNNRFKIGMRDLSSGGSSRLPFLVTDFPAHYLDVISRDLMTPPWYTSCFTTNCSNSTMWAMYGDSHKGAALKFRSNECHPGTFVLNLTEVPSTHAERTSGSSSARNGVTPYQLEEVRYGPRPSEIDFFRFIGVLPWDKLRRTWHCNESGQISHRLADAFHDENVWRSELWQHFHDHALTKTDDWRHESEYRIIRSDILGSIGNHRKLSYDFTELKGIILGIKSGRSDTYRIAEIVTERCRETGRTDFELLQAQQSRHTGRIETVPISLF